MSKKSDEKDKGSDKRDLEEEDESTEEEEEEDEDDEDEEEDEEEEEEAKAAPAKPAARPARRGSVHTREEKRESADVQQEDPYWWTPHAVLGALVLIGVLGFLGVFNNTPLRRLAAPVGSPAEESHETKPATPPSPPPAQPRPMPSGQQAREMFGAKHLLVMYKGSRRAPPNIERSKDEAKTRAAEAQKKAKADPSKFADLVKEYSDEPGAAGRGGDLGKFPKGSMVPEFQAGLEKIKVNEVSDIVETPFGFHVILRTQ